MLQTLPVPRSDQLFIVNQVTPAGVVPRFSYVLFEVLRRAAPSSSELAAMSRVATMTARVQGSGNRSG